MGQQNHDMGLQLRDMQLQMQRQQGEQEQVTGDQMESSPLKRPKEQEPTEARSLDTAQTGSQGVGMELTQEAQVQEEVGYETVTFTNNSSTRYVDWLYCASANANKLRRERVGAEPSVFILRLGGLPLVLTQGRAYTLEKMWAMDGTPVHLKS